jgi:hypothetical protein
MGKAPLMRTAPITLNAFLNLGHLWAARKCGLYFLSMCLDAIYVEWDEVHAQNDMESI